MMADSISPTYDNLRILIVGGVAAGAACAARARRISENAAITIFERGPYVSFANCGLPYYIGDVIKNENNLLVASPELFKNRFQIEVRVGTNVTSIDREKREIEATDVKTNSKYRVAYDALVLAPGAFPVRPELPGIDLPGIFSLRTIPDSREIRDWITKKEVKSAVIVGGGFIGLEMADNLVNRGIIVSIVEMQNQVVPSFDAEMTAPVIEHLAKKGVILHLGNAVAGFTRTENGQLTVSTNTGISVITDMVILAIGVRPEIELVRNAGLEIGKRGGIRVDEQMRTSDNHIWAVGDAVEVKDFITDEPTMVPLAGPAGRQGRIAADVILGRSARFRGVQATAICNTLGITIASTGATEKTLNRARSAGKSIDFRKIYIHPDHHARYYPGATRISLKLLFSAKDGKIFGAQAVGREGVDKRIDAISLAIQNGDSVFDLEDAELGYAPQFGAVKDPVNIAGMVAANVLRGDSPLAPWEEINRTSAFLLDVRDKSEFHDGHIERAVNIPVNELRSRLGELPRDIDIWIYCGVGQRSYYATRILRQNGFSAFNLSGGYQTYYHFKKMGLI
jgi:NADPH-dependent 2,4-dienoyl-CoA reductase/sulfur reductase-like enzyme/rhodanese-related sulfurtransferase